MKILNIIETDIIKSFLVKKLSDLNVEYSFAGNVGNFSEALEKINPEIIILQDEYYYRSFTDIYNSVKDLDYIKHILVFASSAKIFDEKKINSDDKLRSIDIKNFDKIMNDTIAENGNSGRTEKNSTGKKKILFVDDNYTIHTIIKNIFKNLDYEIIHAYDGKEGYDLYRKNDPDLIITDINMPVMDGLQMCKKIKEEIENKYIPVIILSQLDKQLDMDSAFDNGADDYLVKPMEPAVLIEKVEEFLLKKQKLSDYKILIVDDSKLVIEIVSHALMKNNLNVITALDGDEGYKIAKNEIPDIIVTDIEMPKMDGYELCRKIKETPELSEAAIIMMSSRSKPSDIKKGEKLGITHYITKPFDSEKLVILIDRILLEKNNLLKKENENMLSSITALITALEARDIYTKGHTARVSEFSIKLAKYMGFSKYELQEIEIAANLHDIGKIGIRDDILLKPGRLTDEEYNKIKEHPEIGAGILKPIRSLNKIIPLVLHHHERWDGKGYPDKLEKEKIPLSARIIAIADTFDAVTSERSYKGISTEEALKIIEENLGTQFCPVAGGKFINMIKNEKTT